MMAEDCVTPFFEIVTRRFPSMRIPITDLIFKFIKTFIKIKLTEKKERAVVEVKLKLDHSDYQIFGKFRKCCFF